MYKVTCKSKGNTISLKGEIITSDSGNRIFTFHIDDTISFLVNIRDYIKTEELVEVLLEKIQK